MLWLKVISISLCGIDFFVSEDVFARQEIFNSFKISDVVI